MNSKSMAPIILVILIAAALAEYKYKDENDLISKIQPPNNMSVVAQYGNKVFFLSTEMVPLMTWDQARTTCHDFELAHARFGNNSEMYSVRNQIMFIVSNVWVAGSMKGYVQNPRNPQEGFEWDDGSDLPEHVNLLFQSYRPLCLNFFTGDDSLRPEPCTNLYPTLCQLEYGV